MQPLIWDRRPDGLRAPALVCAFEGWNDAGDAASSQSALTGDANEQAAAGSGEQTPARGVLPGRRTP